MTKVFCKECEFCSTDGDGMSEVMFSHKDKKCLCPSLVSVTESWYERKEDRPYCNIQNKNNNCQHFKDKSSVTEYSYIPTNVALKEELEKPDEWHDVIVCDWTERERGFGQRPDGTTMHLNMTEYNKFIEDFERREKLRNPSGEAPDEYSMYESPRTVRIKGELYDRCVNELSFWVSMTSWWRSDDERKR